jgi:hypothetical protein
MAMKMLEMNGKFCNPTIRPNGQILVGETIDCSHVGTVFDTEHTISENIRGMKCNHCGLYRNIPENVRKLIGEV